MRSVITALLLFAPCAILNAARFNNGTINSAGGLRSGKIRSIGLGNLYRSPLSLPAMLPQKKNAAAQTQAEPDYQMKEVYAYPNPAKRGKKPVIHVEAGVADSVDLRFYDVAGELVHRAEITSPPSIIDDGQGAEYAYEYVWDGDLPSGTYLCVVRVHKSGSGDAGRVIRLAVIR